MNFFWDLHQQRRLRDQDSRLEKSERGREGAEARVARLEERLEKLVLVNVALWELARGRMGLTEEDLVAKVNEIDLRDGAADGKRSPSLRACGKCNRSTAAVRSDCLYCGTPFRSGTSSAFDGV